MSKKIRILLPQPCSEDWNSMTREEKGRFCASCKKTVVDFRSMTDAQLAGYLKKQQGPSCGRFMPDQINRGLQVPGKSLPWVHYFFQIALPAFLVSCKDRTMGPALLGEPVLTTMPASYSSAATEKPVSTFTVSGVVKDVRGEGISGANILIKGRTHGTVTDEKGNFSLTVSEEDRFLIISFIGYETREAAIGRERAEIILTESDEMIMGLFVAVPDKEQKDNFPEERELPAVEGKKRTSLSLFPNPVSPASTLTLAWTEKTSPHLIIRIYTASGQLVYQKEKQVSKNSKSLSVSLPPLGAGTYQLALKDKASNLTFSEKFIVIP